MPDQNAASLAMADGHVARLLADLELAGSGDPAGSYNGSVIASRPLSR